MAIHCESFICPRLQNLHSTIWENLSHNVRTKLPKMKLTRKELEARIIKEHFLGNRELLPQQHLIMDEFGLLFVHAGVLLDF